MRLDLHSMKVVALAAALPIALLLPACGNNSATETSTPEEQPYVDTTSDAPLMDAIDRAHAENAEEGPIGKKETLSGTFVGIEMGDYMHFVLKDDKGEERSFFISPEMKDEVLQPFEEGNQDMPVTITWQRARRDIPESGGMMELEEVTDIKPRK